ncbi:hypothetical protein NDU88_002239 [Pleurodeles waltl]|uniref:Reverse transcriptase domain-containing protein n=1 Tax=Pleurodeles waltl TaxID=8319 RepID=A0AAV7T1H2_PLEWA|nr:hypothetical protein NDU88_002239 [Pleurodeles waltl]
MKAKITQLYLDQDIIKAQTRRQECYEFSERVGKVLAYKTRQKVARSAILAIKDRLGQVVCGDALVLQVFKEYYSVLYQQENLFSDDRDERITQYLSDIPCTKLTQDEDCQLTAPIELDEIILALTALSNGKATGPDMIPIEFFKTFFEELKDDIMALFPSVQAGERVPGSWLEANIVIFLKKEKNPLLPGSYRPISLINADAKWYAKILAVRLSRVISGLVSPWQHGFIPGQGTAEHVRRVITMLDASQVMAAPMSLILLEAEKAFDREVVITPQLVLLGIDGVVYLKYSQRFLFLAMSVARCCITSDWLESTPPTFNHWLARMCSMFYLEMGSYACKGRTRKRMGEAIWAPFAQWLGNN